jgi:hypothetical protein
MDANTEAEKSLCKAPGCSTSLTALNSSGYCTRHFHFSRRKSNLVKGQVHKGYAEKKSSSTVDREASTLQMVMHRRLRMIQRGSAQSSDSVLVSRAQNYAGDGVVEGEGETFEVANRPEQIYLEFAAGCQVFRTRLSRSEISSEDGSISEKSERAQRAALHRKMLLK